MNHQQLGLENNHHRVQLSVEHITGGIIVYLTIVCCSCVAFCVEIVVYRKCREPKPGRLWKFMDKMIDDKRHGFGEMCKYLFKRN